MLDLEVILEFMCCSCDASMGVTVKCACKVPGLCKNAATSVKIPCPICQSINQVVFNSDDGTVLHVAADRPRYMIPVPSSN